MTVKKCTRCKIVKPLDDYYISWQHKDCAASRCKPCDIAANRASQRKHKPASLTYVTRAVLRDLDLKQCTACLAVKPRDEFYEYTGRHGNIVKNPKCKLCLIAICNSRYTLPSPTNWSGWGQMKKGIAATYQKCRDMAEPHEVDHIIPLNAPNVSGLHVPSNLCIIPVNTNRSKGNRYTP